MQDTSMNKIKKYVISPSFCRAHINENAVRTISPEAPNIQ